MVSPISVFRQNTETHELDQAAVEHRARNQRAQRKLSDRRPWELFDGLAHHHLLRS